MIELCRSESSDNFKTRRAAIFERRRRTNVEAVRDDFPDSRRALIALG
jgi:hypothetical protein